MVQGENTSETMSPPEAATDPLTVEGASETILDTLREIWSNFLGHLPLIVAGMLVLLATAVVTFILKRIVRRLLHRARFRRSLKELFERIAVIGLWTVGLLLAAMVVFPGISPADALAALGIGSIAIGLAFKDIFENFFAGILILWKFPFEIDDFIECNGLMGRVEDITVRNTLIRTVRGELVVIPNATIYKNPVEVLTSESSRRLTVICGVAYGEDVGEARRVIDEAVRKCKTLAPGRPVEIFAQEFADSSINFEVTWWTGATPLEQRRSRDEVVEAIKKGLDSAGIEIPFPYRTLTFKGPIDHRAITGDREST